MHIVYHACVLRVCVSQPTQRRKYTLQGSMKGDRKCSLTFPVKWDKVCYSGSMLVYLGISHYTSKAVSLENAVKKLSQDITEQFAISARNDPVAYFFPPQDIFLSCCVLSYCVYPLRFSWKVCLTILLC